MNIKQTEQLIKHLNAYFEVDLMSKTRKRNVIDVRHTVMHVMRNMGYTTTFIGEMFNKDHATVVHASRKLRALINIEPEMRVMYGVVKSMVEQFIVDNKILTRKLMMEESENMKILFCKILKISGEDVDPWLEKANISNDMYESYTYEEEAV